MIPLTARAYQLVGRRFSLPSLQDDISGEAVISGFGIAACGGEDDPCVLDPVTNYCAEHPNDPECQDSGGGGGGGDDDGGDWDDGDSGTGGGGGSGGGDASTGELDDNGWTADEHCTGKVDYPHKSQHVPGTLNVVARTRCDVAVPQIHVDVKLERCEEWAGVCWWLFLGEGMQTRTNSIFVEANAPSSSCESGLYRGFAHHRAIGSDGRKYRRTTKSPEVEITC